MIHDSSIVAVYDEHKAAEETVKLLAHSNFDMQKLSIVGRGYHPEEQVVGYYNMGSRMMNWGSNGAFWGFIWGMVFGSGLFFVPGVGPLVVGGPLIALIVAALESAAIVGGLTAFGAALYSLGVPRDTILKYESALKADKYILIANGTREEVLRAREIIARLQPNDAQIFDREHAVKLVAPS